LHIGVHVCGYALICRLYIVFVFGVPFVTLVVLNAFLVNAVRLSRKRSRDLQPPNLRSNAPDLVANAPSYQLERNISTARMISNSSNYQLEDEASARSSVTKMTRNSSSACQLKRDVSTIRIIPNSSDCHLEKDSSFGSSAAKMTPNSSSAYQLERDFSAKSSATRTIPNSSSFQLEKDISTKSSTARIIFNSSFAYQLERDLSTARMIPNSSSNYHLERDVSTGRSAAGKIRSGFSYQLERLRRSLTTTTRTRPSSHDDGSSSDYQLEGLGGSTSTTLPRSPSPVSRRIDTTVMLIGVVIIFIVCQFPALVSRTIWAFADDPSRAFTDLPLYALNESANFLVLLNSSVNIIPYYFFGRRFRRQFLSLFCPYCEMRRRAEPRRTRCDSAADSALFNYSASHHRDSAGNQHIL